MTRLKFSFGPFEVVVEGQKETDVIFQASFWGEVAAHCVGRKQVAFKYRSSQGYDFYEVVDLITGERLPLGQRKDGSGLWPKGWEPPYNPNNLPAPRQYQPPQNVPRNPPQPQGQFRPPPPQQGQGYRQPATAQQAPAQQARPQAQQAYRPQQHQPMPPQYQNAPQPQQEEPQYAPEPAMPQDPEAEPF